MTSGYGVCDTDRLTCGHVPYFPQTSLLDVEILDLYELKRTEEEKKRNVKYKIQKYQWMARIHWPLPVITLQKGKHDNVQKGTEV